MRLLTYCHTDADNIAQRLGTADYSYHFVHAAFAPALERFATLQRVDVPEAQADTLWHQCRDAGEDCLLLSFAPPDRTPQPLQCPVIPVFAWEYPNLPAGTDESCWADDPRHDWRSVFLRAAGAVTLSDYAAQAVRDSLGEAYPILTAPTPVWEQFAHQRGRGPLPCNRSSVELCLDASVVDSALLGLNADALLLDHPDDGTPSDPHLDALLPDLPPSTSDAWTPEPSARAALPGPDIVPDNLPEGNPPTNVGWALPPRFPVRTRLRGVVYTAVLTPSDGRKNWQALVTAFTWAFRNVEDATLVLKLGGPERQWSHSQLMMVLSKMAPLKCRVIAIHGYLSDADYRQLIGATTYYVNASLCEGLCMPLVEFLSCGVPAIAPDHTSMADYIDPELAFVIESMAGLPAVWPHGDREVYRTYRYQINWYSLMSAYRASYLCARNDLEAYTAMSEHALRTMRAYCSAEAIAPRLQSFLTWRAQEYRDRLLRNNNATVTA